MISSLDSKEEHDNNGEEIDSSNEANEECEPKGLGLCIFRLI